MSVRECFGCKGMYPEEQNIEAYAQYGIARYGVAIPECMKALSDILVKESENYGYPQLAHRLIIDAVGLQHPPHLSIQKKLSIEPRFIEASIQSVWIHGLALYCIFVQKKSAQEVVLIMKKTLDNMKKWGHGFADLKSPSSLGNITALDVKNEIFEKDLDIELYTKLARDWADAVWSAWKDQHGAFAAIYEKYGKNG